MAENIVINNTTPAPSTGGSSGLAGLIRPIATLLLVVALVALVYALILLVDNWEAIVTFFTTGLIGYLNPYDSPEGDKGPVQTAVGNVLGPKGETALSLAWWWPGNWF